MGAYGLVPQALRETGRTFRDILSHEATGRVDRAQLGLARTKLGYDIQKDQREVLMNTPNTVANLVNSLPVTNEQKQQIMNTSQYKFSKNTISTYKKLGDAMKRVKEEKEKYAREDKLAKEKHYQLLVREGRYTSDSIEKYVESMAPKSPQGDAGLLQRVTVPMKYSETKEGALTLAGIKAGAKKALSGRSTAKKVVDFLKGRRFVDLNEHEQVAVKQMLAAGGTGLRLETVHIPEETNWLGGVKTPSSVEQRLVPEGQATQGLGVRPQQGIRQPVRRPISSKRKQRAVAKDLTATMPPAEQHNEKIIRDTKTGKRYKSDGTQWIEID